MPASYKIYNTKLLKTVEQTVTTYDMLKPKDSVVIGVSGGPDSVALLHILLNLAPRFSLRFGVAHFNHCLRQNESDKDADFVSSLSQQLSLPCYIHKEDVRKYQAENKLSMEEAARHLRYTFFRKVAKVNGFDKIALGHHCDDNAELVLMNLLRGSGPLGLSGIPPIRNGEIIRPLINITRSEILKFLKKNSLKYVSDSSNKETRYLRNRIRHHLIPFLKTSYNPNIIDTLNRLSSILRNEEEWIEDEINHLFEKTIVNLQDNHVALSVQRLNDMHIAQQRRIIRKAVNMVKGDLRRINFFHIDSAVGLIKSKSDHGNIDFPNRVRAQRTGETLIFSKEKSALRDLEIKSGQSEKITFNYEIEHPKSLLIKEINTYMSFTEMSYENMPDFSRAGQRTAFFDKYKLNFPLTVRNFRSGDRFRPLGMIGTQKVKKYFIDKKIPRAERYRCPILLSQGKIIWVVGHRIDESVKVMPSTRKVLKVELFLA